MNPLTNNCDEDEQITTSERHQNIYLMTKYLIFLSHFLTATFKPSLYAAVHLFCLDD